MARKKRKRPLRPRIPSRVRKRKGRRQRGQHHTELWGLGFTALGIFLATLFWFGWDGGLAGGWVEDAFRAAIGAAAFGAPATLLVVGLLMVARNELVDVRPFRTGLAVLFVGLLLALGSDYGGFLGTALEAIVGTLLGTTGATIVGVTTLVFGGLLLSGASAGALVRRSGHAVRTAATRRREPALVAQSQNVEPPRHHH